MLEVVTAGGALGLLALAVLVGPRRGTGPTSLAALSATASLPLAIAGLGLPRFAPNIESEFLRAGGVRRRRIRDARGGLAAVLRSVRSGARSSTASPAAMGPGSR